EFASLLPKLPQIETERAVTQVETEPPQGDYHII
ncbi:unnamed protein product, partial [marine sediment metagenome]